MKPCVWFDPDVRMWRVKNLPRGKQRIWCDIVFSTLSKAFDTAWKLSGDES